MESSPSTDLVESLVSDWRRAVGDGRGLATAFAPEELQVVQALDAALAGATPLLLATPEGQARRELPAWLEVQAEAHRAWAVFSARSSRR